MVYHPVNDVAARIGVCLGDNIFHSKIIQRIQKCLKLALHTSIFQSNRVKGHNRIGVPQWKIQRRFQFCLCHQRHFSDIFHTKRPHRKNPVRRFSQLDNAVCIFLRGRKVQIAELCNRMADSVIHRPFRNLAAVKMRDRYAGIHCRQTHRKRLIPIPQHNKHVRPVLLKISSKRFQSFSHRPADRRRCISFFQNRYFYRNGKSIVKNLPIGISELLRQVGAGHQQGNFQVSIRIKSLNQRP